MDQTEAKNIIKDILLEEQPSKALNMEQRETNANLQDLHNSVKEQTQQLQEVTQAIQNIPSPELTIPPFPEKIQMEWSNTPAERAAQFFSLLQGMPGKPFTYDDFTQEQLDALKVKGDKGDPGIDGKDANEEKIIRAVVAKIPIPKNGLDGQSPKVEEIVKQTIKEIKSLKGDNRLSLRIFKEGDDVVGKVALHANMMKNMPKSLIDGDQRWGGHGLTLAAGSNITITTNADGSQTIASTASGGSNIETPTGVVDGSNVTFTVLHTPLYIVSDGTTFFENQGYTLAGLTLTLSLPPVNFIRSFYS